MIRSLEQYYKNVLDKGISNLDDIDVNTLVKEYQENSEKVNNSLTKDLEFLLELIVGVAVLCENKNTFITKIFNLDETSQLVLKDMVEHVMQRVYDIEEEDYEEEDEGEEENSHGHNVDQDRSDDLLLVAQEAITELKRDKEQLLEKVNHIENENNRLRQDVERYKELEFERSVNQDNDRSRAQQDLDRQKTLQHALDELQARYDHKLSEFTNLEEELVSAKRQLEEHAHIRSKLEVDLLQLQDSMEVLEEKSSRLTKAEATISKYQEKIETLNNMKQQNLELEQKLEDSHARIQDLEISVSTSQSTSRVSDKLKDQIVVLERKNFELHDELGMKNDDLSKLQNSCKELEDAKKRHEQDLVDAMAKLELVEEELQEMKMHDKGVSENTAVLKDKVRKLEDELRKSRASANISSATATTSQVQDNSDSTLLIEELRNDLEICEATKKERENLLLRVRKELAQAKQELSRTQQDLVKANEHVSLLENSTAKSDEGHVKELETQLAIKVNAVLHLEELLKESKATCSKLEHDKEKLEIFAKRSLTSFKDKYMTALQRYKEEKSKLDEK